ncbi:MAG: Gfo/Idh/MocA family oxidoreductase [Candidatus Hydrogenedentes bacterium]|nr:Gfo/Idh/MocA family oxidoreductase [Candidatus Hydrogenedentota bacterium]
MARKSDSVFNADKRIRLGIWGLGRGMSFYRACQALNFDVVAGCDYNAHMRERFLEANPGAFATDDADAFLSADFDAVLLATFCPAHADDAVACLEAGKHVLSEVTAFHTMAEGVRLVEAAEKSRLVYNLAENYPFSAAQMYVARRWKEGLFGDLMYAEGEYVHEIRSLAYTHIDGVPIEPGYALHNWRSWLNFHYYCTHSLGPIMVASGTRPVRVVSLPGTQSIPGYPPGRTMGMGTIAPSLITMDNGAVVRNLMGGTTNDVHQFRYWGTKGSAEIGHGLFLRLGGGGGAPKLEVTADWGEMTPLAEKMGHGGGDFWVLYYFARQILFGEPAPWDIHSAADVTIPGILAYRSSQENGQPYDVPDFRNKAERDAWRNDEFAQPRYDVKKGCFPRTADKRLTGRFNTIMKGLLRQLTVYRAYADWIQVFDEVVDRARVVELADALIKVYPDMRRTMRQARRLADAYPRSDGARVLNSVLEAMDEQATGRAGFLERVKKERARLKRKLRR